MTESPATVQALDPKGLSDLTELIERLDSHMGLADMGDVLRDCRLAARALAASLAQAAPVGVKELWQELLEKDDRTSPAEYPDMALITFEEFSALFAPPPPAPIGVSEAMVAAGAQLIDPSGIFGLTWQECLERAQAVLEASLAAPAPIGESAK